MQRKRPETKRSKIAKMLIEEYQPQSAQDIQEALKDLLGDTMEELLKEEWQNRPLEKIYPMVFLDAIHYHVRENNIVVKKAVYIALGYNLEGF
ncbi:MAG: transposase, partial [Anaerococcus sp.]|nr:transposase [Anaerococcus sp.]